MRVTPSEEAEHASPMEVTPTSGKGTLELGGSIVSEAFDTEPS